MKNKITKSKIENEEERMLDEAMKNPGVADYMDIYNKYSKINFKYNSYFKIMYQYYKNRSRIQNSSST